MKNKDKMLQDRITEVKCEILQCILFDFRWSDEEDTDEDKIGFRKCCNIIQLDDNNKINTIKTIEDIDYAEAPINIKEEFVELVKMSNDIVKKLQLTDFDFWDRDNGEKNIFREYICKNKDKYKINFPKNLLDL